MLIRFGCYNWKHMFQGHHSQFTTNDTHTSWCVSSTTWMYDWKVHVFWLCLAYSMTLLLFQYSHFSEWAQQQVTSWCHLSLVSIPVPPHIATVLWCMACISAAIAQDGLLEQNITHSRLLRTQDLENHLSVEVYSWFYVFLKLCKHCSISDLTDLEAVQLVADNNVLLKLPTKLFGVIWSLKLWKVGGRGLREHGR